MARTGLLVHEGTVSHKAHFQYSLSAPQGQRVTPSYPAQDPALGSLMNGSKSQCTEAYQKYFSRLGATQGGDLRKQEVAGGAC